MCYLQKQVFFVCDANHAIIVKYLCLLCEVVSFHYRERSAQENFQLILITHDMKFVDVVGRSGMVDNYSLVKKEIG